MITIEQALRDLFEWASERDFAGHDPHDLLSSPILSGVHNPIARLVALQIGRRSAIDLHKIFRVPASENPKGLALFIMGLLRAKSIATPDWQNQAQQLSERLILSMCDGGGWGYPFPWQSRTHFLAKNTPNIVTTSFAGTALIELHHIAPSESLLKAIAKSAVYVASLKALYPLPSTLYPPAAFGYAANDPQIVFNASLLGGEFLLKAGKLLSNPEYLELAHQSAEFVASHQQTDGAWAYGLEPSQKWIDSFHTGFTIVSMKSIADSLGDAQLAESALKGFEYYKSNFLEPDYAIRYFPNNRYPIDAHALGQAMVTFIEFGDSETARRIAEWAIANMRSANGYFYYQRHRLFTNRIAYIRWSNGWIFRGLSSIVAGFPGLLDVEKISRRETRPLQMDKARKRIWIDLENSPHVPFFIPIILELERAGCEVILTARDFAQTKELVDMAGLNARIVGGENGSSKFRKAFGLASRSTRLAWMMKSRGISLAVGHGSRGLLLATKILRIPMLTLYDYEGASVGLFNRLSTYVMTPEAIPFATLERLGLSKAQHLTYPGLKEDVYVSGFKPSDRIINELGLDTSSIIITIRPPSSTAHYRSEESFLLYDAIMKLLAAREDVQIVLVPRERKHSNNHPPAPSFFRRGSLVIPNSAVDGLNLLYHSDLVISGGGTMNREAAALGVPTVTIFKGPTGAVDQWLIDDGKMVSIERAEEIIPLLVKRTPPETTRSSNTKDIIVQTILQLIA